MKNSSPWCVGHLHRRHLTACQHHRCSITPLALPLRSPPLCSTNTPPALARRGTSDLHPHLLSAHRCCARRSSYLEVPRPTRSSGGGGARRGGRSPRAPHGLRSRWDVQTLSSSNVRGRLAAVERAQPRPGTSRYRLRGRIALPRVGGPMLSLWCSAFGKLVGTGSVAKGQKDVLVVMAAVRAVGFSEMLDICLCQREIAGSIAYLTASWTVLLDRARCSYVVDDRATNKHIFTTHHTVVAGAAKEVRIPSTWPALGLRRLGRVSAGKHPVVRLPPSLPPASQRLHMRKELDATRVRRLRTPPTCSSQL